MNDFVELVSISPKILLDIRYATSRNFTGRPVYTSPRCFLRRKTADRLHRVQLLLENQGYGLKVYDGYRPLAAQKIFWSLVPDARYVADPAEGSCHNRGASVDLTLVDAAGRDLPMPTEFDDFSERASHAYQKGPKKALFYRDFLKKTMMAQGFIPYENEWWHYDDPDWESYPIVDVRIEDLAP